MEVSCVVRDRAHTSALTRRFAADRRGQNLQDFTLGVALFLVTMTFVLGFFPTFLSPYVSGIDSAERTQADQVAKSMLANLSTGDGQNELDAYRVQRVVSLDQAGLRERFGLPDTAGINVTVRTLEDDAFGTGPPPTGAPLRTEETRENQTAASAARIVRLTNTSTPARCRPGCRLVVRVW